MFCTVFRTELGWMGLVGSPAGLKKLVLPEASPEAVMTCFGGTYIPDDGFFTGLHRKLTEYLSGKPVIFDEILDIDDARPFFKEIWKVTRGIPYGETRSYKWLATQAGSPKAARAAGQAMARNPVPIIVPCHRVITSQGTLGGFGGGLELKRHLLELEASWLNRI